MFLGKNVQLWVGGYAVGKSRKFTWIATGEEFTYSFWSEKNPDFYQNSEFCVEIGHENMKWNDNKCSYKYGFICEFRDCCGDNKLDEQKYPNIIINNF